LMSFAVTRAQSAKVTPARTQQFLSSADHSANVDDLAQNKKVPDCFFKLHS